MYQIKTIESKAEDLDIDVMVAKELLFRTVLIAGLAVALVAPNLYLKKKFDL